MHALLRRPLGIWAVATAVVVVLDLALNVVAGLWRQAHEAALMPAYVEAFRAFDAAMRAGLPAAQAQPDPLPASTFDLGAALQQTLTHGVLVGCLLGVVVMLAAAGQRVLAALGVLAMTASVGLMAGPFGTVVVAIPGTMPESLRGTGTSDPMQAASQRLIEATPYQLSPTWFAWAIAVVVGALGLGALLAVERGPDGVPATVGGRIPAYAVPVTLVVAAVLLATTDIDPGRSSDGLGHQLMWWITAVVAGLSVAAGSVSGWRPALALTLGWGAAYWLLLLSYGYDGGAPRGWGHDSTWAEFPVYASAIGAALVIAAPALGFAAARVRDAVLQNRHAHRTGATPLAA